MPPSRRPPFGPMGMGRCGPRGPQQVQPSIFSDYAAPPARPERGEARFLILDVVAEGPIHGYEIMATIEQRTGGRYRPSPGTVYPTLQALEKDGLIESHETDGRKTYALTEAGRGMRSDYTDDIADIFARLGGDATPDHSVELGMVEDNVNRIVNSVGRALRAGRLDDERQDRIIDVISDAAREIEKILRDR